MFENTQSTRKDNKCSDVAEKIVNLFGWRQTYNVEKFQKSLAVYNTHRGAKEFLVKQTSPESMNSCHESMETEEKESAGCNNTLEDSIQEFQRNQLQKSYLCLPSCEVSK